MALEVSRRFHGAEKLGYRPVRSRRVCMLQRRSLHVATPHRPGLALPRPHLRRDWARCFCACRSCVGIAAALLRATLERLQPNDVRPLQRGMSPVQRAMWHIAVATQQPAVSMRCRMQYQALARQSACATDEPIFAAFRPRGHAACSALPIAHRVLLRILWFRLHWSIMASDATRVAHTSSAADVLMVAGALALTLEGRR